MIKISEETYIRETETFLSPTIFVIWPIFKKGYGCVSCQFWFE